MPNAANIDAPIVLVGQGRSGTSLVSNVFALHPDCAFVGETANLVFGVWSALRASASLVPPLVEHGRTVPEDERAGRLVRQAFLMSFPDDRARWMHKPIGVPNAIVYTYTDDPGGDEAAAFYWRVLRSSFPDARYVTVLRHPCDVVLSGLAHWGQDQRTLWRRISDLSRFLLHRDAPAVHPVFYDDLVRDPNATVRALCLATDLEFDAAMLGAFQKIHVAAPGRDDPAVSGYSRRHEWDALDPAWVNPAQREAITAAFAKYGRDLEWPQAFKDPRVSPDQPLSDAERVLELEALVKHIKASFERTRVEYEERTRLREEDVTRVWNEQRAWIAELERGKAWLEDQVGNWRAEAERLQREARG